MSKGGGRPAARAIVIRGSELLVMHRNKYGSKYIVLVGGRLEPGESAEDAVLREAHEETGLTLVSPRLVFIEEPYGEWGKQHIYLCNYTVGEPHLQIDSEEYASNKKGENTYTPAWYTISELRKAAVPFRSERLRSEILHALEYGFPDTPKQWTP